jgi:drug/metabolite transporter (DMT)-like permease
MLYILLSILLFSFNNVLWKKNLEKLPVSFLVAYRAFFTSTIALLLFFYYFHSETVVSPQLISRITTGSVFGVIGLFSMLSVIQNASLQWLGIYNLLGIVFTSLYLWFFEKVVFTQSIFGLILILMGFIFYIYSNKEAHIKITIKQHALLLLMTMSFSISSLVHWKNLKSDIPPLLIISNQEIVVFVTAFILTIFKFKTIKIKEVCKNYFFRVILMAFIIFLALLFSFLGLKITNPVVSSVLFLASPLTTILLSALIFREQLTIKNGIAIFIIATGAFILHYYTV